MTHSDPAQTKPKIGDGHAKAMMRQGLKELQAAVYPGSNVAREAEPGTFGTPTQGEIAAQRRPDDERSVVEQHVHDARPTTKAERGVHGGPSTGRTDSPEPERE